jgi:hypothetical protein
MRGGVRLVPALLLLGCSSNSDPSGTVPPQPTWVGASGISITQVAIYQGPKRVLMQDGVSQPPGVPLVAGRPAFLRLFHRADGAYDGQQVLARLELGGVTVGEGLVGPLQPESIEEDVGTSVGFPISGELVASALDYKVSLLQERLPEADNPAARWSESVAVEGKKNTFRMVIVPYRYDADGSGRLPNTSPEQLEIIKSRFMGMYPVSNVEITVHEPVPWSGILGPQGDGWQQVGFNLLGLKNSEGVGADVYYYGMFNPAANLYAYCGTGCLLGVTLLNNNPPETGQAYLRLALGVGFDNEAPNTCAHEIGHAHGRAHVNCGYGVAPDSIDPEYPYDPKTIGGFGWDVVNGTLIDPSYTDIMGYCQKQWISDYNYTKLFTRTQNVNLEYFSAPEGGIRYDIVAFDGLGTPQWLTDVRFERPVAGRKVPVRARARSGAEQELDATFVRYDHLNGGWLFLPAGQAINVTLVSDGVTLHAERP